MENPYAQAKSKPVMNAGKLKYKFKHKNIVKIKQDKEKLHLVVLTKYEPTVETI